MASLPTQRSLAECKKRGWTAQVVEKWNHWAKRRVDLFGVIDIVALTPGGILGIQASASGDHATHREKILAEPRALEWIRSKGTLAIWSWGKKGPRGKRKVWSLMIEVITADMFDTGACLLRAARTRSSVTTSSA